MMAIAISLLAISGFLYFRGRENSGGAPSVLARTHARVMWLDTGSLPSVVGWITFGVTLIFLFRAKSDS